MKKGFTIVEVSILFVIFLIVAILVAPMSLDDTTQAKNTSRWRTVQQDFSNIFLTINNEKEQSNSTFIEIVNLALENETKNTIKPYKITYMNGKSPKEEFKFKEYKKTFSNAVIATEFYEQPKNELLGVLMYDVNGEKGPNVWGKDVFGLNIYSNKFQPFGKEKSINIQKQDCSKLGTGLFCSNYYLIGGHFD